MRQHTTHYNGCDCVKERFADLQAQVERLTAERNAAVGLIHHYVPAVTQGGLPAILKPEVERQRLQREENKKLRGLLREWLAVPCQCDMSDAEHEIHGCESSEIEGKTREALGDEA